MYSRESMQALRATDTSIGDGLRLGRSGKEGIRAWVIQTAGYSKVRPEIWVGAGVCLLVHLSICSRINTCVCGHSLMHTLIYL